MGPRFQGHPGRDTRMQMDVTVIIPVLNDEKRLALCLDALARQETDCSYEVLVVDNGSDHSPRRLIENSPYAHYLFEPGRGSYRARNAGLRRASGAIIAFTDSDCIPDRNWIHAGVGAMEETGADLVGGRIAIFFKDPGHPTPTELFESLFAFDQERNVAQGKSVTANLFVRSRVFGKIGAFEEGIQSGGDMEFTRRATGEGFRIVYGRDTVVRHPARHSLKAYRNKTTRVVRGWYDLRDRDKRMAWEFSLPGIMKQLVPPVFSLVRIFSMKRALRLDAPAVLKVIGVLFHNKVYGFWYKMKLVLSRREE